MVIVDNTLLNYLNYKTILTVEEVVILNKP